MSQSAGKFSLMALSLTSLQPKLTDVAGVAKLWRVMHYCSNVACWVGHEVDPLAWPIVW